MRSEDILPGDTDTVERGGVVVRKGSVGAFLANVQALGAGGQSPEEREAILADLRSLVPALGAVGLFDAFEARDPVVRSLIEDVRRGDGSAAGVG